MATPPNGLGLGLAAHWPEICAVFARAQASSGHCAIASVSADGFPNATPVGFVFLRGDGSGFYFDPYTKALAENIQANGRVCVMAVNAGKLYWLSALLSGRFNAPPGVRLYGSAGPLRDATAEEIDSLQARIRSTRWLKGNRLLWSGLTSVRELAFTSFRPVEYPVMMDRFWRERDPRG